MKRNVLYLLILVLVLSLPLNKVSAAEKKSSLQSAIEAGTANFVKEYNAGNTSAIGDLYTKDAKLMPPNGESVTGTEAIVTAFKGMMDSGAKGIKLTTDEVIGSGNSTAEVGAYEIMDAGGKTIDQGKYIVIWKKEGASWKVYRDMWNSNMPVAPANQ